MKKRLSEMSLKNWVEVVGFILIICAVVSFAAGIAIDYFKAPPQANNHAALITLWKKGFLWASIGFVILILSSAIGSSEKK